MRLRRKCPIFVSVTILIVALCGVVVAHAEWEVGVAAHEGVSLFGGPIGYRMAAAENVDARTGASTDAITSASRISHAGGLDLQLRRGGTGQLVLGIDYVHYRFELDSGISRINMDVVGLRVLALARLVLLQRQGAPLFSFGFGGYVEITVLDRAEIAGEQMEVELVPASVGIIVDLHFAPFRFPLTGGRGQLVPAVFFRGFRGFTAQYRDDAGSAAPLASITLGLELAYLFPSSQGNGRAGR